MKVVAGLTIDEIREGIPIVVHEPIEMLLAFAVLALLAIPLYLSARRRSLRRFLDRSEEGARIDPRIAATSRKPIVTNGYHG